MQVTADLFTDLIETRRDGIEPLHGVTDPDKHKALVADMSARGWVGAPVVADGPYALTGSHRIAAADEAYVEVPRVQISDVCRVAGLDWDALRDENPDWDMCETALRVVDLLPPEITDYLGLDVH